jgi:hypothetical protein
MAFNRYPHSATLTWLTSDGTYGATLGIYVPSTNSTIIALKCRALKSSGHTYLIDENGDRVEYDLTVSTPLKSYAGSIPEGSAEVEYSGVTYRVLQVPPLQRHTILRCKK